MNEKFEEAENVRKRYADYSDETRATKFLIQLMLMKEFFKIFLKLTC